MTTSEDTALAAIEEALRARAHFARIKASQQSS